MKMRELQLIIAGLSLLTQPFLPPGQQPTVAILRGLIAKQTWTPAEIN